MNDVERRHLTIDCPSCHRELAHEYGSWLDALRNCPFCLAPLELLEDGDGYYFATEAGWA